MTLLGGFLLKGNRLRFLRFSGFLRFSRFSGIYDVLSRFRKFACGGIWVLSSIKRLADDPPTHPHRKDRSATMWYKTFRTFPPSFRNIGMDLASASCGAVTISSGWDANRPLAISMPNLCNRNHFPPLQFSCQPTIRFTTKRLAIFMPRKNEK